MFTALKWRCGKVTFSVLAIYLSKGVQCNHYSWWVGPPHTGILHPAWPWLPLDKDFPGLALASLWSRTCIALESPPPQTCSNLFNLDLIVQGSLGIFKLAHYEACTVYKWAIGISLECFLLAFFSNWFSLFTSMIPDVILLNEKLEKVKQKSRITFLPYLKTKKWTKNEREHGDILENIHLFLRKIPLWNVACLQIEDQTEIWRSCLIWWYGNPNVTGHPSHSFFSDWKYRKWRET